MWAEGITYVVCLLSNTPFATEMKLIAMGILLCHYCTTSCLKMHLVPICSCFFEGGSGCKFGHVTIQSPPSILTSVSRLKSGSDWDMEMKDHDGDLRTPPDTFAKYAKFPNLDSI
jgi:hypothetical protein